MKKNLQFKKKKIYNFVESNLQIKEEKSAKSSFIYIVSIEILFLLKLIAREWIFYYASDIFGSELKIAFLDTVGILGE